MEMRDLLNKGLGYVGEVVGDVLVRSERVFLETRHVVNGNLASAWQMWDRLNQVLADTAVPDGRRPAVVRLQLDDRSEAVLPFMAQVPLGVSMAHTSKRMERVVRMTRKTSAAKSMSRTPKSGAGRKSIGGKRSSIAAVG